MDRDPRLDPCFYKSLPNTSKSDSVSCGVVIPFPWVLIFFFFVFALQVWSLFLPVLWKFCRQILLAFKVRFPGKILSPFVGSAGWETWCQVSEPSKLWEDFFGIILQFLGLQSTVYGIWSYHGCAPSTISLQLLLCPWKWSIFSLWVQESSCQWLLKS